MKNLIILDIGHGIDTVGKGVQGMKEFEFNQAVVKHAIELARINNIDVVLTQPYNSKDVPLPDRTKLANNTGAKLLISVHADAHPDKNIRGHWAFYWGKRKDSLKLAKIWHKHANRILKNPDRGIVYSELNSWTNFHMIREPAMPSILVEHGFMTNAEDLKLLKSEDFRRLCAEVIIRTACEYLDIPFKEDKSMTVNIFGKEIKLENVINQDDLNYVQLREIFEKLNCKVDWKDGKTTITLK